MESTQSADYGATLRTRAKRSVWPVVIGFAIGAYFWIIPVRIPGIVAIGIGLIVSVSEWVPETARATNVLRVLADSLATVCVALFGYALGELLDHPTNQHDANLFSSLGVASCGLIWLRWRARAQASAAEKAELRSEVLSELIPEVRRQITEEFKISVQQEVRRALADRSARPSVIWKLFRPALRR